MKKILPAQISPTITGPISRTIDMDTMPGIKLTAPNCFMVGIDCRVSTKPRIKPVMPTIADGFAHLLNYQEHMAIVHVENGKYHVHYEYMEAAKKNSTENAPYNNILKKAVSSSEHVMLVIESDFSALQDFQSHLNAILQYLPVISLPKDFRPPIAFASVA